MKFILQLLFITLLAWGLELFFPWWSIAIAAFAGGFLINTHSNFLAGFLGIVILWSLKATLIATGDEAGLSQKIADILMVKFPILLILITAIIGGLVGGFAATSGAILRTRKRRYRY